MRVFGWRSGLPLGAVSYAICGFIPLGDRDLFTAPASRIFVDVDQSILTNRS